MALPSDLRIRFDTYSLDIVQIDDADEDEVREMFLRLQSGTTLRAQEKRNAYPGKMRDFVKDLASHRFFESVGFSNSRYTHDLIAAQLVCLELTIVPVAEESTRSKPKRRRFQDACTLSCDSRSGYQDDRQCTCQAGNA